MSVAKQTTSSKCAGDGIRETGQHHLTHALLKQFTHCGVDDTNNHSPAICHYPHYAAGHFVAGHHHRAQLLYALRYICPCQVISAYVALLTSLLKMRRMNMILQRGRKLRVPACERWLGCLKKKPEWAFGSGDSSCDY